MIARDAAPGSLRQPYAVVLIVVSALAAWIGLGSLHDLQHADSLLTVLISTQRWTPFFWGQDRFGMLVPLLAMPLRHPLANLLAQGWLMSTAALLAPFVMARFLAGRAGAWMATGACANVLFLAIATPEVRFDWLVAQPYGLSVSLGFAGLIAADDHDGIRPLLAAFALIALACWVNVGVVVLLAIAAAVSGSRRIRLFAQVSAAAAVASLTAAYGASAHTITALAEPWLWPNGWRQLLTGSAGVTAHPAALAGVAAGTGAAIIWLAVTRRLPPWKLTAAILAMAVISWLVVGMSLWVGMNRYVFRYMYPALMVAGVGASTVFAALFARHTRVLSLAALAALAALLIAEYGTPSIGRINRGLDERLGKRTPAVLQSGATVIAGDYWRVWPAVFHANLALARARSGTRVFGLAFRSDDTDALWQRTGQQVLVAGSPDDPSVAAIARVHGMSVTLLVHRPEIDLYAGRPSP